MPGLSTNLVVHKLPTDLAFPHVKQKLRKFKTDMSVKIKEEIIKQLGAKVIRVTQYPIWLANVVPVPKKDGKTRVCVDYCDLNKASPNDNFPFPNIHILIDNCAKHEIRSFMDCYAGYHQILMDKEDAEKTSFITPWGTYCYRVEAITFKSVTKKAVVDFVHSNIICRFGIPKVIITDNAANLNNHLMKEVCQKFKIMHRNSTPYRPKANRAVEAANKNIKKILCATPYLLVYGTEAVIPAGVEILSLWIVAEAEIDDDEWVKTRLEQLSLIDKKRLAVVCHGQLYQKRMARAYNKKVRTWKFEVVQLVLKCILPYQAEAKGKFAPN
nr:uncharacterized protein LOC104090963 [Nicotiana tomentosiformis]